MTTPDVTTVGLRPNWSTVCLHYREPDASGRMRWQKMKVTGGHTLGKRTMREYWRRVRKAKRIAVFDQIMTEWFRQSLRILGRLPVIKFDSNISTEGMGIIHALQAKENT